MAEAVNSVLDRIARKVGEGYDRPNGDSQMPLDINYARLAEWLVDRKQVPADWSRKLQAVQAKAAAALKELPPGFLGQFEGGEEVPLDYLRAKEVLTKLTETAERGFLGGYKGAAGDWDKIVRAYEYNLLHVGEAALTLGRNGDFEIPFLKKQAAKYQQQLGDLERKQADSLKSAAAAAADFQQECAGLGMDAKGDLRAGLLGLTAELPALVGEAVAALRAEAVGEAVAQYRAFSAHQAAAAGEAQAADAVGELLPTLQEVRDGRTKPPAVTAPPEPAAAAAASASGGTDWGGLDAGAGGDDNGDAAGGGGISWDLGATAGGNGDTAAAGESGGISWDLGDLGEALEAAGGGEGEGAAAGEGVPTLDISWDIDLTTAGEEGAEAAVAGAADEAQPAAAAGGGAAAAGGGGAAGAAFAEAPAEVQRLIEDHAYRARLLDDLLELRAFLLQRGAELSSKGNDLLVSSLPEELQHIGADVVGGQAEAVAAAISALTGERLQQRLLLRTSSRHLDRQAQQLAQKGGQEAKFKRAAREAEAKRAEAQRQLMADSAKLAVLLKRTRAVKELAEAALGAKLGRRVNIQGEINNHIY